MQANDREAWERYRDEEIHLIQPILTYYGFSLDERQVHTGGERYLMTSARDVGGGGLKLVLTGTRTLDGMRVIIKISNDPKGIAEIERERQCRSVLHTIEFASRAFQTPEELFYTHHKDFVISITSYIEQERAFIEHTLDEQFFLALRAFETQEGVHATTHKHAQMIKETFGLMDASHYLLSFSGFKKKTLEYLGNQQEFIELFNNAETFLNQHKTTIERYCGFLTHADFVPNNLRIAGRDIFLLDFASIHFGNKYESWARFLNFMIHHNTELEQTLATYIRTNRGPEEYLTLRLMRVYKIGYLLSYYAQALPKTTGNLRLLTEKRINLWKQAMQSIMQDVPIPKEAISSYLQDLEELRSEDEKARQRELLGGKSSV